MDNKKINNENEFLDTKAEEKNILENENSKEKNEEKDILENENSEEKNEEKEYVENQETEIKTSEEEKKEIKDKEKKEKKKKGKLKAFLTSRKAKKGSVAILLLIIFLALVIGLNIVTNLLVTRYPNLSLDMTSKSIYELSSDTVEYLKNLNEDVTINVLANKEDLESGGDYYVQASKLIEKFPSYSEHVKVKYIDLTQNPSFTQQYKKIDWNSTSYLILVSSDKDYRALGTQDLFEFNQESYYYTGQQEITSQHVEQAIITAILNITTTEKTKVTVLTGQDEQDCSALTTLLENNAYEIEEVSLLTGEISQDSDFLIIYAPTVDIDENGLETIREWLNNDNELGHNLIYFPNDTAGDLPNFTKLLNEWGMNVEQSLIFETDKSHMTNTQNPTLITVMDYENETFTQNLKTTEIPVVMLYTLPITISDTSMASPLLVSSEKAVAMPLNADENWNYEEQTKAKLNGAVVSTKTENEKKSNLVVIGSYDAVNKSVLSATSYNNASYFMNMFNTLIDKDDIGITIEGKNLDNGELGITNDSIATILAILVRFLIPIIILIVGLIVWLNRRNK